MVRNDQTKNQKETIDESEYETDEDSHSSLPETFIGIVIFGLTITALILGLLDALK